eukprot:COSAG01_NODE_735_length_13969_cov_357.018241_3_plen_103_part_00
MAYEPSPSATMGGGGTMNSVSGSGVADEKRARLPSVMIMSRIIEPMSLQPLFLCVQGRAGGPPAQPQVTARHARARDRGGQVCESRARLCSQSHPFRLRFFV